EEGVGGEAVDFGRGMRCGEIMPADDAQHEGGIAGELQHVFGLGNRGRRLDQHRRIDIGFVQDETEIRRLEITEERRQLRCQPAVVAAHQAPEMLVAVDTHHAPAPALPGTGASGCSNPWPCRSSQKARGILGRTICQWLSTSAAARAPGMTLATTGWARQNCRAAAPSPTPWVSAISASFFTRSRIASGIAR